MGCLDPNTVLAMIDGRLKDTELVAATEHAASCETCTDLLAAADSGNWRGADRAVPSAETLPAGTLIARRYVVLDLAGRGAMGEVYKALDQRLDCNVALKLLRAQSTPSWAADARARLLNEGKKLARISHPNVIAVRDADEVDGRVFLAMEFVEGQTVGAWLAEKMRPWHEIRDVFVAAGRGLEAAHRAGLVHRDFKPQNVMIAKDGTVRVMDFGLAEFLANGREVDAALTALDGVVSEETVAFTRTGALIGTPYYMAPEHFLGKADARSDQFSFCVAFYHALYGEWPFPIPVASLPVLREAVMAGRLREPPIGSRVPWWLRRTLIRGLDQDPSRRFSSMGELLRSAGYAPSQRYRRVATGVALFAVALAVAVAARLYGWR